MDDQEVPASDALPLLFKVLASSPNVDFGTLRDIVHSMSKVSDIRHKELVEVLALRCLEGVYDHAKVSKCPASSNQAFRFYSGESSIRFIKRILEKGSSPMLNMGGCGSNKLVVMRKTASARFVNEVHAFVRHKKANLPQFALEEAINSFRQCGVLHAPNLEKTNRTEVQNSSPDKTMPLLKEKSAITTPMELEKDVEDDPIEVDCYKSPPRKKLRKDVELSPAHQTPDVFCMACKEGDEVLLTCSVCQTIIHERCLGAPASFHNKVFVVNAQSPLQGRDADGSVKITSVSTSKAKESGQCVPRDHVPSKNHDKQTEDCDVGLHIGNPEKLQVHAPTKNPTSVDRNGTTGTETVMPEHENRSRPQRQKSRGKEIEANLADEKDGLSESLYVSDGNLQGENRRAASRPQHGNCSRPQRQLKSQGKEIEDQVADEKDVCSESHNASDGNLQGKNRRAASKYSLRNQGQPHYALDPDPFNVDQELPRLRKQTVLFTEKEVDMLKIGVEQFGPQWKLILNFGSSVFLPCRRAVDLKDKWRNLLNRGLVKDD